MSPVDPISPTSLMDISPITPSSMEEKHFELPATPIISPSVHLPRLVTSFQASTMNDFRMSVQFQLLTPSPLSLRPTPATPVQRKPSVPWQSDPEAITSGSNGSFMSTCATPASRVPRSNGLPATSPVGQRRKFLLRRENAIDGLDRMSSEITGPIAEQMTQLPIRLGNGPSVSALRTSAQILAHPTNRLSSEFESAYGTEKSSVPLVADPVTSKNNASTIGPAYPRSPTNRHKRWRHRQVLPTSSLPTKVYVRKQQTSQQTPLHSSIGQLGSQLVPLISVRTGQAHPEFPRSLLQYHLLTHDQLDSLVRWYHQTIDAGGERWMYPCPIGFGKVWCGSSQSTTPSAPGKAQLVDLETKRRRWGRFIGLRGCESPTEAQDESRGSITERMEREWREALRKAEEEAMVREKLCGRRFG